MKGLGETPALSFSKHLRGTRMTVVKKDDKTAASKAAPAPKPERKVNVMLGNNVKRYVIHADPVGIGLYEAGIEYPVTVAQRDRLFKERDDNGVAIFYDAEVVKSQMRASLKKARAQRAAAGDEDAQRDIAQERLGEIDTGAVALRDGDGEAVGVVNG